MEKVVFLFDFYSVILKIFIILKTVKAIIPTVSAAFSRFIIRIRFEIFIIVLISLGTFIIVFIFYSPDVKSIP